MYGKGAFAEDHRPTAVMAALSGDIAPEAASH
jgi:hypothetical protein